MTEISIYNLEQEALDRIPVEHIKSHRIRGDFKTGKTRHKTETILQDVIGIMTLRFSIGIVYVGGMVTYIPNSTFTSVSLRVNNNKF